MSAIGDSGYLIVSVADNGVGMPADQQASVFGKFNRSGSGGSSARKRTGLGLAIVKAVIENHKGRGNVESRVGERSTFKFTLPIPAV